jgi:tetratricopeptide (TPR) repeat protein
MNINNQIQLALKFHRSGDLLQAEHILKKILRKNHNNVNALYNLGALYAQIGNYDLAITYIEKSIRVEPDNANAYYILGKAFQAKGELDKAITCYRRVIKLNPFFLHAYYYLGEAFQDKGEIDEAVMYYKKELELNPDHADTYNNMGIILHSKGKIDEAIRYYEKALMLNPCSENVYNNFAIALKDSGVLDKAIYCYQKALELNSAQAVIHYGLSMTLLLDGNFKEGWKEYEWRWKTKDFFQYARNFTKPLWDGSDIAGRTILLHDEQGSGDTIQFIRYASLIAQRDANVVVECHRALVSLLKSVDGIQQVIVRGEELPEFDLYCPLLSLPLMFNTTLESIPAKVPYIVVDPLLVQKWKDKLRYDNSKFKVGLVWAGKPEHKNDRNRSCHLEVFSPLAELGDISFYSLQKGWAAEEAKNPPGGMKLIDYTEEISDFSDTSGLIMNLDLIVSVDTSVVHLAGALGKPVWTLLPFAPDWRWLLIREDCPWYPTMRLFRQHSPGDWESVIANVKDELLKLLGKN